MGFRWLSVYSVSIIMLQKSSAFWLFCTEKSLAINRSSPLGEIRRLCRKFSYQSYSIQQAKHPKRYTIAHSHLYIIHSEETIWLVFYLLKCLTCSAYLKEILIVHQKIPLFRQKYFMQHLQLIIEKCLTQRSFIYMLR